MTDGTAGLEADVQLAIDAARNAGEIAMRYFRTALDVAYKSAGQPVTEADLEVDRALRASLVGPRPEYGWLSEESEDSPDRLGRGRVWVVDPIDGTRSFIAGRPEFTVSIGLVEAGGAVAGVVYNPATAELYHAVRGRGAFAISGSDSTRLRVRADDGSRAPLVLASRGEIRTGSFDRWRGRWTVEPSGSTAYKLARVAAGLADAFVSRGEKSEWDVCAGALIVGEAAGRATEARGGELRYNKRDPRLEGVVAANSPLHARLVAEIASDRAAHGGAKGEAK